MRGMMMGSPVYMAPEQVRALGDLDQRTDVWGLCVTLYELASGERPFDATTTRETVLQVLGTRAPRPAALDTEPALWSIVQRGLAKAPEARWPSMSALGRALAVWAAERGVISDASGAVLASCWLSPSRRAL
jgi:serine/threonine-protein kinase